MTRICGSAASGKRSHTPRPAPTATRRRSRTFRDQPLRIRTPAPLLGEHNEEILQGLLGLGDERFQQLIDDEIVGTTYTEDAF